MTAKIITPQLDTATTTTPSIEYELFELRSIYLQFFYVSFPKQLQAVLLEPSKFRVAAHKSKSS